MKFVKLALFWLIALWFSTAYAQTWQPVGVQPVPAGAVMYFALQTCPAGWLEANGAPLDQSTYPKLYVAVGANLPDLRGEFLRGWDHGRGVDSGRVLGSYQADETKAHTHGLGVAGAAAGVVPVTTSSGTNSATAANGGSETRPRNMALLVCIKY